MSFPPNSIVYFLIRSHSWLSYGAEKIQERVWLALYHKKHQTSSVNSESEKILNPCLFKGYRTLYYFDTSVATETNPIPEFISLEGTGDALQCRELIRQTLWPNGCSEGGPCPVDDIEHPPVDGLFFGIVYFIFDINSFL